MQTPPRIAPRGRYTSPNSWKRRPYLFTASFSPLPAEKRGRLAALIWSGAPVRGSLPSRAALRTTWKLPNPVILTPLPFFNVDWMVLKVASTADAAATFVRSALLATAAISSCLFIEPFLSLASIEAAAERRCRAENLPKRPDSQAITRLSARGRAAPSRRRQAQSAPKTLWTLRLFPDWV